MSLLITFRNSFAKGPPNEKIPSFCNYVILQFEIKVQKCYRLVTGCQLPKTVEKKSSSKKWLARLACTLQLLAKRTKSKTKRTTTTTTSCNLAKSLLLFHAHTTHPKKLIKKATKQHSSFQRLYKQRCRSLLKMAKRDTTTK